jgi:hypothetical protein
MTNSTVIITSKSGTTNVSVSGVYGGLGHLVHGMNPWPGMTVLTINGYKSSDMGTRRGTGRVTHITIGMQAETGLGVAGDMT